jgi:hypothetical protein
MHLNRFADLKPYQSPGHHDMRMLRMQGREAGPADVAWLGVSQLLPGGRIDPSASAEEKFYVVLEGNLTIETDSQTLREKPAPFATRPTARWWSCSPWPCRGLHPDHHRTNRMPTTTTRPRTMTMLRRTTPCPSTAGTSS